jgi:polyisoprenoid-binding protein YceI
MLWRRVPTLRVWIFILLFHSAPALAQDARGSAQIVFTITSTLHDLEGTAGSAAVALTQTANGTWLADVSVPVTALDTGNSWRDSDMREMLDAEHHPQIRARFRDVDPEKVHSRGVLPFVLRIRTVERPIQATVQNWRQSERAASFDAAFDVSLKSFQLEAPSRFFMTVGDEVRVNVHVKLERAS